MSPFSDDDHQRGALAHLRKESLDVYNRIHSIAEDAVFVERACAAYPELPVLPNLRCGAWYVRPDIASEHAAYFKSTDGHYDNWSFNLRRPNVHLLDVVSRHGGLLLVDATRSGKRMPDALSKTVPIWCAVVNRAIRIRHGALDPPAADKETRRRGEGLYTPPGVVSPQEHRQIASRVGDWADALANASYDLPDLRYPLRPVWITPSTTVFPSLPPSRDTATDSRSQRGMFFPVVCVSASKRVEEGTERRQAGFAYIQGSGDDHEAWGMGLTPHMFWEENRRLLAASRAVLPSLVSEIVSRRRPRPPDDWVTLPTPITKAGGGRLLVCAADDVPRSFPSSLPAHLAPRDSARRNLAYVLVAETPSRPSDAPAPRPREDDVLVLAMPEGKKGQSAFLRDVLPRAMRFLRARLQEGRDVCVACHSGKDASVGIVLVALQVLFDQEGKWAGDSVAGEGEGGAREVAADKRSLGTRLQWIIADRPEANPSRVTLKRVNEFLLTLPAHRR